jgi:hypothetical protein
MRATPADETGWHTLERFWPFSVCWSLFGSGWLGVGLGIQAFFGLPDGGRWHFQFVRSFLSPPFSGPTFRARFVENYLNFRSIARPRIGGRLVRMTHRTAESAEKTGPCKAKLHIALEVTSVSNSSSATSAFSAVNYLGWESAGPGDPRDPWPIGVELSRRRDSPWRCRLHCPAGGVGISADFWAEVRREACQRNAVKSWLPLGKTTDYISTSECEKTDVMFAACHLCSVCRPYAARIASASLFG